MDPGLRHPDERGLSVSLHAVSIPDKLANEQTLIHRHCSATSMSAIASVDTWSPLIF